MTPLHWAAMIGRASSIDAEEADRVYAAGCGNVAVFLFLRAASDHFSHRGLGGWESTAANNHHLPPFGRSLPAAAPMAQRLQRLNGRPQCLP
jgi:hypothetical protein